MNHTFFRSISKIALLLIIVNFIAGCNDDKNDLTPGLSVEQEMVETFPGDTILIAGTASNYAGLASVTLSCESWNISKVFDLSKYEPTVFNYEYQLIVPETATFDENLHITVRDVNGKENKKYTLLKFLPDTQAPVLQSQLPDRIAIDFDPVTGKGTWNLNISFTDDRALKEAILQIPDMDMDEKTPFSGRSGRLVKAVDFTAAGEYPVTITIADRNDNQKIVNVVVVVMFSEDEDHYQDYAQMYVINANENADDYVNGYYRYMDRTAEYQYTAKFYAPADNTPVYFVPSKTTGEYLFGTSPHVSSKLLNKNGYVQPVVLPKKGYYTITIDIDAHTYSLAEYTVPADTYTGQLIASGTGFTVGDWGYSDEMTLADNNNPYRKKVEMELVAGYAGDYQYYFVNNIIWTPVFRSDVDGNWWFEAAGGACIIYKTDYAGKVVVTFDTAELWATIKKITD